MNRNRVMQGLGMLLLPAALMSPVMAQESAQNYPSRPVTLVIPYPAGGPNDLEGRLYMGKLTTALGKPFVIDFKPGAGGVIGHDHVAKSKADGYTLLLAAGSFTIQPSLSRKLPYDTVKDFAPVSLMSRRASVLVANMNFPAKTFQEYLAYAKANPGKINFGTTGVGSTAHMGGAWMHSASNTRVTYVHYKGLGPMLLELVSGPLDVGPSGLLSAMQLIRSGKLRPLAIMEDRRSKLLPDVPTAAEQGIPGFNNVLWLGVLAPAETPAGIVNKLADELAKVARAPDIAAKIESEGSVLVGSTPAEFRELISVETARWQKVVREAGIKIDD